MMPRAPNQSRFPTSKQRQVIVVFDQDTCFTAGLPKTDPCELEN
jgi:hypothetical protein